MFITFEGIEGSGKSTQIELLRSLLKEEGHAVEILREPGTTQLGEKIRDIFLEKTAERVDPITEAFLLYASRKHLDQNFLQKHLKNKSIVIADRYSDATIAYQCFGKGLSEDFVQYIHEKSDLLSPDLTFYLDITAEASKARIDDRELDRMESESLDFFNKVRAGYLEIAKSNAARVIILDAELSVKDLQDQIFKEVKNRLDASLG
ncbi:MAG: dTMP kinase [Gammaproteobacteria bacterium]|nr:dTMP kinase [Gammaproteobacteria bacterium]|tara:strand:- start:4572 stop:5189 length:618 start_codon:yes stop_codon:yes gene_type:complete